MNIKKYAMMKSKEKELKEYEEELQNSLQDIEWLNDIIDNAIIDTKIFENGTIKVCEYMKLKSELYSVLSEW